MESLADYGSDDDCEDTQEEKKEWRPTPPDTSKAKQHPNGSNQVDVNYEEVQMDLSEESDGSDEKHLRRRDRDEHKGRHERDRDDHRGKRSRDEDDRYRKEDRSSYGRENDRDKDRERDRDRDRNRDRDKYRDDRRRDRQRSRSRSPRRSDYRSRRSRSRDHDRERDSKSNYAKRYERGSNKTPQADKTTDVSSDSKSTSDEQKRGKEAEKDRFFMPGITGRFKDQIEKRKLLWQKKDPEKAAATREVPEASGSRTGKLWEATTFAQDSDGKVASKFKRLMGIRNTSEGNKSTDVLKKQEEMFSSMEQQYEVARTATHTMRGVGLVFGSFQR